MSAKHFFAIHLSRSNFSKSQLYAYFLVINGVSGGLGRLCFANLLFESDLPALKSSITILLFKQRFKHCLLVLLANIGCLRWYQVTDVYCFERNMVSNCYSKCKVSTPSTGTRGKYARRPECHALLFYLFILCNCQSWLFL